jgi:hypothetical protein
MQLGGYFVSDEVEKAALGDAFQRYQEAERYANLFAIEMGKIGKQLTVLAEALLYPQTYALLPEATKLTIGKRDAGLPRPLAEITEPYLNWENIRRLLVDYQVATATKIELAARLGLKG